MVNIKQPPAEAEELIGYLSALAASLNREFIVIEERLNAADGAAGSSMSRAESNSAAIAALDERITALEDE